MKEEERLKKEKQDMLGFYDYTVVLTYISLVISVFGMTRALAGDFKVAILCLALSGLCDMFDGKIARTKKDRTEDEKKFGIQIDSLCDVVCFGVFPALICYCLGMDRIPGIIILCLYCVVGIKVLPPSVNESDLGFTVSGNNIRYGLLAIKNLGRAFIDQS